MIEEKRLKGTRIGVLGKGGAGKSTFVVVLALALRQRGYDVCIIDADSTNYGLPQVLGMDSPRKTLLDFYGGMIFSGGTVTCPVDDPTPLSNPDISISELSPLYYTQNDLGITLLTAGKIADHGPGAGCDGPVAKIARDLIIQNGDGKMVTLVDFKAGFEDSARGVLTNLDWVIVVVDPTRTSVEIAASMRNMVDKIKANILPATKHLETPELVALANKLFTEAKIKDVFFVLNKIPDQDTEKYLREKLHEKNIEPIATIFEDPSIPKAWLIGGQIHTKIANDEILKVIELLERSANGGK
jgi:CO dehydrogenase nickel-insertion accessory protein CooC1